MPYLDWIVDIYESKSLITSDGFNSETEFGITARNTKNVALGESCLHIIRHVTKEKGLRKNLIILGI